ncbi:dihydroorotase [Clostridia bacterium]|nr:dihydroorotase [Clostridia bacterium]
MENILIKNGRVLDPATNMDQIADVWIVDGVIKEILPLSSDSMTVGNIEADVVLDATGCFVMPGFIDLHVHLREPGFTYKESVETGAKAAAHGGFTTILAMPNTKPTADNGEVIRLVHKKGEAVGSSRVLQIGAITKGQEGQELADFSEMIRAGTPAVSEDGKAVKDAALYLEGMKLAAAHGIPVLAHCEDLSLVRGGVMNDDERARELGLPGITKAAENVIVARDIMLAKEAGVHLHLCHCSTLESVELAAFAKKSGICVTAEVCPHHFVLNSGDIPTDDGNFKMSPPLRTREDQEALKEGLKKGIIDVIATDHAPHSPEEKNCSMKEAAFGIIGLETAAALTMTELVEPGVLTPIQMAEKMSYNPAKILKLDRGSLAESKVADVVVFDPRETYVIDANDSYSKSRNTPFAGKTVKGRVRATIVGGRVVYER